MQGPGTLYQAHSLLPRESADFPAHGCLGKRRDFNIQVQASCFTQDGTRSPSDPGRHQWPSLTSFPVSPPTSLPLYSSQPAPALHPTFPALLSSAIPQGLWMPCAPAWELLKVVLSMQTLLKPSASVGGLWGHPWEKLASPTLPSHSKSYCPTVSSKQQSLPAALCPFIYLFLCLPFPH